MPRLSVLVASCTFILGLLVTPADAGPKGPEKVFAEPPGSNFFTGYRVNSSLV